MESTAFEVIFTSCLCQNPNERGASDFDTTREYDPVQRAVINVTQIIKSKSQTVEQVVEPKANLIPMANILVHRKSSSC